MFFHFHTDSDYKYNIKSIIQQIIPFLAVLRSHSSQKSVMGLNEEEMENLA